MLSQHQHIDKGVRCGCGDEAAIGSLDMEYGCIELQDPIERIGDCTSLEVIYQAIGGGRRSTSGETRRFDGVRIKVVVHWCHAVSIPQPWP